MLLAIDIGNTDTVFGIFNGDDLKFQFRISTNTDRSEEEYRSHFLSSINPHYLECIDGVAISCVVPKMLNSIKKFIKGEFNVEPRIINAANSGLHILAESPRSVGSDLIANSIAALKVYGVSSLVVDCGTATTFSLVEVNDRKGSFLGVSIAPGLKAFTNYLGENAAQLPKIEFSKPEKACGINTITSMKAGIYFGYVGMVKNIMSEIKREYQKHLKVIMTGGISNLGIGPDLGAEIANPDLTLMGIKEFYKLQ